MHYQPTDNALIELIITTGRVKMTTIKVKGMSCQHCVASVTKALSEIEGITDVQVSLEKGEATFTENSPVPEPIITDAIAKIGFEVVSGLE